MSSYSTESLIQTNVSAAIEAWILDLVLDRAVYEMRTTHVPNQPYPYFIEYSGRNSTLLKLVNDLLTTLYKTKDNNIDTARFGVHPKQRRHISINVQRRGEENATQIAATFSHLSSGEQAILGIFFSILRAFDGLGIPLPARLDDVAGVVLIDEADLHLHVDFQNKVLPALLKRFPKIQWIISTHSPLLILGLNEQYDGKIKLVDLPGGQQILPSEFSEFQRAYEIFVDRSEQFKAAHDAIFDQIRSLQKPLVITEGKTDWKHLKAALAWLQTRGEFSDLDVQFHEYDSDLGDDQLEQICRNIAFMGSEKIIICMFDRDNKKIVPKVSTEGRVKNWGNNVFSFVIPEPGHRQQYNRVSIEFYYSDADLKTPDPDSGRRLFFSNEVEEVRTRNVTTNATESRTIVRHAPLIEDEYDKYVYDRDCERIIDEAGNQVAWSKNAFAEKILNGVGRFAEIDRTEFAKIFAVIKDIIQPAAERAQEQR